MKALKALRGLNPRQLALFAWYRFLMHSGYLERWTKSTERKTNEFPYTLNIQPILALPETHALSVVIGEDGHANLLAEAEEIVNGRVRLFGGPPVPLRLDPPGPLAPWTAYESGHRSGETEDIKWTWEPARFGWAFILGRAYHISGDDRFPAAFWTYAETFLDANPTGLGPNWASAQEVALRLVAFAFSLAIFDCSPQTTLQRKKRMGQAIIEHAARIPPTLAYARAQNNNHLLTEAVGLFTAATLLPTHPSARRWRDLGWRWSNRALQTQIAPDGTYTQQSTNYHRLMLQAALWLASMASRQGRSLPETTLQKLAAATRWLLALIDPETGRTPNLGPNDGALILPLATCSFHDYRPILQAAGEVFLGERPFEAGPWDEMLLWLWEKGEGRGDKEISAIPPPLSQKTSDHAPHILRSERHPSWAYLRVARFVDRPGHADQLHLDLWWRGINIAQDAGTYLYNAPPPWENALAQAGVHNTLTVCGQDQMTRAGRFLYLDWAQAALLSHERAEDGSWERLVAQHDGYRRLGVTHQRSVTVTEEGLWAVQDTLLPTGKTGALPSAPISARLHWLLPDWPWELEETFLRVLSPHGWINLTISLGQGAALRQAQGAALSQVQLVRAGQLLAGTGPAPTISGWVSPTYGYKDPALSLAVEAQSSLPLVLVSEWRFPKDL